VHAIGLLIKKQLIAHVRKLLESIRERYIMLYYSTTYHSVSNILYVSSNLCTTAVVSEQLQSMRNFYLTLLNIDITFTTSCSRACSTIRCVAVHNCIITYAIYKSPPLYTCWRIVIMVYMNTTVCCYSWM
jgi:hypothetical protein